MGCNSHLTIEVKKEWYNGTRWETYALDIPESRDYTIYELMAGVRGEEEKALISPRGIPTDVDMSTKSWIERWEGDVHTHSYLTAAEFRDVLDEYPATEIPDKAWLSLGKVLDTLEQIYGKDRARVVFFFDN